MLGSLNFGIWIKGIGGKWGSKLITWLGRGHGFCKRDVLKVVFKGETKGKEVDLAMLLAINPTLSMHSSTSIYGAANDETASKVQMRQPVTTNGCKWYLRT